MKPSICDVLLVLPSPLFLRSLHEHDFHEIVLPIRGTYTVRIDGIPHRVEPNQAIFYPAGFRHEPMEARDGSLSMLLLQWYDQDLTTPFGIWNDEGGHLLNTIQWLMETKDFEGMQPALSPNPHAPDSPFTELRQGLLQSIGSQLTILDNCTKAQRPQLRDPIDRTSAFIHVNFRKNITVEQLAKLAEMPRSTFMKKFKDRYATTPISMLTELRMRKAASLLQAFLGDESAVAAQVGYGTVSHFRRVFKSYYGKTVASWLAEHASSSSET